MTYTESKQLITALNDSNSLLEVYIRMQEIYTSALENPISEVKFLKSTKTFSEYALLSIRPDLLLNL